MCKKSGTAANDGQTIENGCTTESGDESLQSEALALQTQPEKCLGESSGRSEPDNNDIEEKRAVPKIPNEILHNLQAAIIAWQSHRHYARYNWKGTSCDH